MNASQRLRPLNRQETQPGNVLYWMSEDQRVQDNYSLLQAARFATEWDSSLLVVFCLQPTFLDASWRQYAFMLNCLKEVEEQLREYRVPFSIIAGNPVETLPAFVDQRQVSLVITDFSALRIKRQWKNRLADRLNLPFCEVDSHNIIPCWLCSDKQEFAAHTIRRKIQKLLPTYLREIPPFTFRNKQPSPECDPIDWPTLEQSLNVDFSVPEVDWLKPGEQAARAIMQTFIAKKLNNYDRDRNNPCLDGQSHLSPYLHFGQISAQRVALEVLRANADKEAKAAFIEELTVRRELAQNYCFYNEHYDSTDGFPEWAQRNHDQHRTDPRDYCYSQAQFENAETHDPLWNAAQKEMARKGKMHGYMRMYWAKKILEWTASPEEAMAIAIYLNDKYELDGRDPNGYAGIAWSIGGVHDRPWQERPVFGKIRYMNSNGCKRKFDVNTYIGNNRVS